VTLADFVQIEARLPGPIVAGHVLRSRRSAMRFNPLERWYRQVISRQRKSAKRSRGVTLGQQLEGLEDRALLSAITPAEMRQAYGIDEVKFGAAGIPGNGAGQTIGIIEIGTDASLVSDLQYFDQQLFGAGATGAQLLDTFGSYAGPVSGSTKPWFDTIQDPRFPPSVGTAKQDLEAALDVEWAHVIAPMANIVVVQTASNQSGAAYVASQTQLGVSTVASSYYLFPNLNPANYSQPNVPFVGITGDTGTSINSQQVGFTLNNFPASSPAIIAVGGTTLTLNADGSYGSETGWGFAGPDRFLTADQAYIAPGYWNAVSGGFSGTYYTSPGPSGSTSTVWSTTITSSDVLGKNDSGLELSATWTPSPSNADNAQYEIYDDGTLVDTVTVNQQLAPNGTPGTLNSRTATFQELAALTKVSVGDTIQIVVPAQNADGSVVIDAIGLGPDDASGGGLSNNPQPSFQNGLVIHDGNTVISSNGTRATPDVAFDGDYVNSPVEIYNQGAVQLGAGTSLGAPAWAALLAIADQGLALSGQPAMSTATALAGLYSLPSSDFHDETSGYNGYSAGPGYDLVTGLGSPVANQLIPDLDNAALNFHSPAITNGPATSPAILDTPYSFQYRTTGSPAPTFTLVPGSALPTGFTLSSAGLLSGEDTNLADIGRTFTGSVDAGNGIGNDAIQAYSITVNAPASRPSVKIVAPLSVVLPGEPVPLLLLASDTNATARVASFRFDISYGDGTTSKVTSKSPLLIAHIFKHPGTYTLTVTASDEYGHVSAPTRVTIKVLYLPFGPIPFDPNQPAMIVGETSSSQTATFSTAGSSGITVTLAAEAGTGQTVPLVDYEQGVSPGLTAAADLLENPMADNPQFEPNSDAIQWAAVSAAVNLLAM
jgi:hypothetical protein